MLQRRTIFVLLFALFCTVTTHASHIVGGEVTYKYLSSFGNANTYEFIVTIYEDCQNGSVGAIQLDNPGKVGLFLGDTLLRVDSATGTEESIPVNFQNKCVSNIPVVCLRKKSFHFTYTLPLSDKPYTLAYQRCCRNAQIQNILRPDETGATYFCTIPPQTVALRNSSAVFKDFPAQIICARIPLYYDNSATDPDGDSLSYSFDTSYIGASQTDSKPDTPTAPPYQKVTYLTPTFSAIHPIPSSPLLQIDPITGILTGTPSIKGRFLVTVCVKEWRNGVLINIVRREFQYLITDCSKKVVACMPQYSTDVNTYIVECRGFNVHFDNCSKGGFSYHWNFGDTTRADDTSNIASPDYTFSDTGIYTVTLVVNPGSTCPDSIKRYVKVFPYLKTYFRDSGTLCPGDTVHFFDQTASTIRPITDWNWSFGDGTTDNVPNTKHAYARGGTYNVILTTKNIRNCNDTTLKRVIIEDFQPYAGRDTLIVKGESVTLNATGGNIFMWSPATYLDNPNIYNPTGYFPDTGRFYYIVDVESRFGCKGKDTVRVWVVNQEELLVPTAFSPNNDGRNDFFKPISAGYKSINFFNIYDRYGELVFTTHELLEGWDGTYKGKPMEIGTYFWQLSFKDIHGNDTYRKGDVTLVR